MIAIPKFLSTPSRTRQWNFFARPISAGSERKNHGYEPPNRPFVAHPGRLWASGSIYPQDFPHARLYPTSLHPNSTRVLRVHGVSGLDRRTRDPS